MSKYTVTIKEILDNDIPIFDFEYPVYKPEFKPLFEQSFIDHFYFDEIGFETIARFKHNLKTKLNLIMPYWNKVYMTQDLEQRILDNYSITETFEKTNSNTNIGTSIIENTNIGTINSANTNTATTKTDINTSGTNITDSSNVETDNTVNVKLYKDAPKTKVDIEKLDTVNNITKDQSNTVNTIDNDVTASSNSQEDGTITNNIQEDVIVSNNTQEDGKVSNNIIDNGTESWTRNMDGNIGVQTDADAIIKYWLSLRKVTEEIFNTELSVLFMGVY